MNKKLAIIGAGNMGSAIYKSALSMLAKKQILVCDANPEKRAALKEARSTADANTACAWADVIVLAVKPQSFAGLCESIKISLKDKLIISIMAGISAKMISEKLLAEKIIRAMPNLAMTGGKGVTIWVALEKAIKKEKAFAADLFSSAGVQIEISDETILNKITPLTGSGPAYFFYLVELMEAKARAMGFSSNEARIISEQTLIGCAKLLEASQKTAAECREAITSKRGVTEAAFAHLKKKKWGAIFFEALEVGTKRAKQLGASKK